MGVFNSKLRSVVAAGLALGLIGAGGGTPAFAVENPVAHTAEPASDWEWGWVSSPLEEKPLEVLKPELICDNINRLDLDDQGRSHILFTFTLQNVKPNSRGTVTFHCPYAVPAEQTKTVVFTADSKGNVKASINVTVRPDAKKIETLTDFSCLAKVKKRQQPTANVELLKKADGTFDLIYKFPKGFVRTVKLIPSLPIISDLPIYLPDGTAITPQPQPKNPESSFISPSSNSFANSTADSMSIHLVDGTSGKSLDGENFVSYRLTLTIQDKKGDVIASSTPYESTNPHLPSEITFKNLQLTKDFNQDNYTCSSEIKFLTVPQSYEMPPNEQLVFPFKVHSQTEENLQVDDPSEILHSLLQTDHNIKSNNNYKNADKQLQEAYDKAISDGQKIYDKLSSSPEEVKSAAQAIQSAIDALNGDEKEKEVSEKLSTQIQKLKEQLTQLQSQLTKANSSINADKNKIQQLNSQIFSLSQQLEKLKNDKTQSDQQKQAEIDRLNKKIADLDKQIEQLTKDKGALQSQLTAANDKIQKLSEELKKAKQQNTADASTISNLNKQLDELKSKLEKLQNDKTLSDQQKQAEIDRLNKKIAELEKQVEQLTKDKSDLQSQIEQLKKKVERLTETVNSCSLTDNEKAKELIKVKKELQDVKSSLEQLKKDKEKSDKEKQEEISQLTKQIDKLTKQLETVTKEKISLQSQLEKANNEIKQLSQQIDDLKNQISQKDKEIEKLKAEKFQCPNDQDKQKLESQITQLQKEKEDLQNKVKSLQKQLEQAKQQIKDLKKNETKQPLSNQDLILPTKPINNSNSLQNKTNVQPADNQAKEKTVTAIKQEEDIDKTTTPKEDNSGSNTPQQSSDDQQPINPITKVEKKILPKTNDLLAMPFTSLSSLLVTVGSIVLKRRLTK